jgi:hypothetical protein
MEALRQARTPEERQLVLELSGFSGAGRALGWREGEVVQNPDGTWEQILYNPANPQEQTRIPATAPLARSTRPVNEFERIAHELFGAGMEDPRNVRLSPEQMQRTAREMQLRQSQQVLNDTVARGSVISADQKLNYVTQQQARWKDYEAPFRDMQQSLSRMDVGLRRFIEGDRIGGSQAVLVTFQRILDENSVVRESEYARSAAGLPWTTRLEALYGRYIGQWDPIQQRWIGGGAGVPERELREMVETARQMVEAMRRFNDDKKAMIVNTARRYGIDPNDIMPGWGTDAVGQPPSLQQPRDTPPPQPADINLNTPWFIGPDGRPRFGQ